MKKLVIAGMLASMVCIAGMPSSYAANKADVKTPVQQVTKLDINTATVAQLTSLKGIGQSKAKAIVEYREKIGGFTHIDDLKEVKGIGEKLALKLQAQISF